MENSYTKTDLETVLELAEYPLMLCIDHCNQTITEEMEHPFEYIDLQYQRYKALLALQRAEAKIHRDYEPKIYQALKFPDFYRRLDMSIKKIVSTKQPAEVYFVFRYE